MQATAIPLPGATRSALLPVAKLVSGIMRRAEVEMLIAEKLKSGQARNLRFLRSRLRCREDVEDVLQDFGLKAFLGAAHAHA